MKKKLKLSQFITKWDKQAIENYCPVLLLPICEKIFEWILSGKLFFTENYLIFSKLVNIKTRWL